VQAADHVSVGDVPARDPILLLQGDRVVGPSFLWHVGKT
jgi:hypothetical protein